MGKFLVKSLKFQTLFILPDAKTRDRAISLLSSRWDDEKSEIKKIRTIIKRPNECPSSVNSRIQATVFGWKMQAISWISERDMYSWDTDNQCEIK